MKHLQCRNAGVLLAGVLSVGAVQAQAAKGQEAAKSDAPIPAIQDWSSRTVISGKPMLPDEFIAAGRTAEMEKRYRDPRYVAGVLRRIEAEMPLAPAMQQRSAPLASAVAKAANDRRRGHGGADPETYDSLVHRDWSNVLGNGNGGNGPLGVYPAKYNFDLFAGPSCADDFVVYGTNAASATASGTPETRTSTMSGANPAGTITIGTAPRSITLTASGTPTTNLQFLNTGTDTAQAAALAAAVNVWGQQTGVTATSTGAVVTYTRIGNGNTDDIAIASTLTNHTVNAVTAGTGTSGQPSILAFNQLYNTTCNATRSNTNAPNTMWAYNTSTLAAPNAIVETSPVLSYYDNGKQVAYIQRSGNVLQLILLKWQLGQGTAGAPVTPTLSGSAALYRSCVSGCYYAITLAGTTNTGNGPTYSSPYVDYTNDLIWVGDGNSQLHKFSGVFQGNPVEVSAGGFPVSVATAGLDLSPAVADDNFVYIGSQSGATAADGGRVHRVPVGGPTVPNPIVSSAKLYADARNGFRAPMILDTGFNRLNTFAFSVPGTPTSNTLCQHQGNPYIYCRAIVQFDTTNFIADGSGTKQEVGLGSITGENVVLWMGAFDDAYYSSGTGTGAMYMCGGSLPRTQRTTLWKVPYVNGVAQVPVIGPQIVFDDNETDTTIFNCSPPTVIKSGSNEYLFVSTSGGAQAFASAPGCGANTDTDPLSNCMFMFNLNDLSNAAGTSETWVFTFGGNQTVTGGTFVIGGVTLVAANNDTGLNFNVTAGNANTDRDRLAAKINSSVPGYTATTSAGGVVNITRTAIGNAPAITEGLDQLTETSNTQGTNPDVEWASTSIPRAALQVIGGTGGIIVDNVQNATTGAQQIYTTQAGTIGNAVQASQSGLQ